MVAMQYRIAAIQDDLDFIRALLNHCLNGPINPLLSVLASKNMVSLKHMYFKMSLIKNILLILIKDF